MIPLEEAIGILVAEAMTAGRGHMGEILVTSDSYGDGQKEFHQGTCLPHDWNQALNCGSALQFYGPQTTAVNVWCAAGADR